MKHNLAKIKLTPDELAGFIDAPTPRPIPVGMRRQVLGESLPLVFVGIAFMIAGLVAGTVWWINATTFMKPLALGFYLFFPGIGSLMTFGTLSSRRKKVRTLRSGTFAEGRITKVRTSGMRVNDQQQYEVDVEYEFGGKSQESQVQVTNVDRARDLQRDKTPVRLLVDPVDHGHVVVLDLLTVFD